MHFEKSIDIDASQQRVWDVVSDIEAWPRRVETVETLDVLTGAPLGVGSRVKLKQPKLPEAVYTVTAWDAPSFFEWVQKGTGSTIVAGHRVESLGDGRSRLVLTIEMSGFLMRVVGRFYKDLTERYLTLETQGMKRAAEGTQVSDS